MFKIKFFKNASLALAALTMLLSFMTVPVLGKVNPVYADSASGTPEGGGAVPAVEKPAGGAEATSEPAPEQVLTPEEPEDEFALGAMSLSAMSLGAEGDDPAVQNKLPDFGNTYNNGDCVTNDACETAEPVTNPNQYSDQGTYGKKDYTLPDIGGNKANIVAIKEGNQWYFFKKGSGETCLGTTFCVEFDDQGHVSVYSYQTQGNGYKGYNMIHFWYVSDDNEEEEVYGCTDRLALNFNPAATMDDGNCEYEIEIYGCTDPLALNFNSDATMDDQTCEYEEEEIFGCTDPLALNFNPKATADDQSCTYEPEDPGDEGGGGGTTTVTTTALIPVTAPGAGGPTEELLLIPVTGVDLAAQAAGLRKVLLSASGLFLGISLMLAGVERKVRR
jgi:hypothetical protein